MSTPFPSVQSFFPKHSPTASSSPSVPGDGFTSEEIDAVMHPRIDEAWMPTQHYEEVEIAALEIGPKCVTFCGRVANFYDQSNVSKRPTAAKGCLKIVVKDDGQAVTVRLWYANMKYRLRLGQLVSVWTPHISHGEQAAFSTASAPLFASIFPERDRSCHFMIHEASDTGVLCKTPLGYREGRALPGLMTLQNFVEGGYDVSDGRILVVVKIIGARKKITTKKGITSELINIGIFEDTAEATLTLWGPNCASAAPWKPSHTVLLITNPGWKIERKTWISITSVTQVDVDPCIPDAEWLRTFAARITRREHVNPPFPGTEVLDFPTALSAPNQILYTLASLDDFARSSPTSTFIGFLSVVILELHIMRLHQRTQLMCTECCGVPLFANTPVATCKQCEQPRTLRINPRLLGAVVDETGCTSQGKLVMSERAWEGLLGRSAMELCECDVGLLRYLEQRVLFLRVTLLVGWVGEDGNVGRLCVAEVRM